eukprot:PITA_16387
MEGSQMFQFQQKLKNLKFHIRKWNQFTFGNIFQENNAINNAMTKLQQKIILEGQTEQLSEQETCPQSQILERDKQEEVLWRKKSQNNQGGNVEDHATIKQELLAYFKQVHQETKMDRTVAIDKIIQSIRKIITEAHNQLLLKPISLQEVEKVVRQLKEGKAPGPDGFTSIVFHNF